MKVQLCCFLILTFFQLFQEGKAEDPNLLDPICWIQGILNIFIFIHLKTSFEHALMKNNKSVTLKNFGWVIWCHEIKNRKKKKQIVC